MWKFEYVQPTGADPEAIWGMWSDPARWPEWDDDLEKVRLEGEFAVGSTGALTPKGMDSFPFTITRAEPGRGYSDETPLPGAVLRFDHDLVDTAEGRAIRQTVTVDGPRANDYFDQFAESIVMDIPGSLARFSEKAEQAGG
jgi:hypothetical protein